MTAQYAPAAFHHHHDDLCCGDDSVLEREPGHVHGLGGDSAFALPEILLSIEPTRCNEKLRKPLTDLQREAMKGALQELATKMLDVLRIDHSNDHNTRETAKRWAKMMVDDINGGRFCPSPAITEFDNVHNSQGMIVTGPITVRSMCAHHMLPIYGEAYIGVIPSADGNLIGLSKFDRIVNDFAMRPQIQEELTNQIGTEVLETTNASGVAVYVNALHMCKILRGVKSDINSRMTTPFYNGLFKEDANLRREFLSECHSIAGRSR